MTPRIVARSSFIGETGTVNHNLFTSPGGGLYRVSVYYNGSQNPAGASVTIGYTDSSGSRTSTILQGISTDSDGFGTFASFVLTLQLASNGTISWGAGFGGNTADVYFVVEEL